MTTPSERVRTAFSENEVRSILARAAELEATGGGGMVTVADLRKIAADAGIDSGALERAIAESRLPKSVTTDERSGLLSILTLKNLGLVLAGSVLGAMAIGADGGRFGELTAVAIFAPSAVFTAWRALHHRHRGSVRGILGELGPLFGSFALTLTVLGGQEGLAGGVVWGLICGLGAVAIANRQPRDSRETNTSQTG